MFFCSSPHFHLKMYCHSFPHLFICPLSSFLPPSLCFCLPFLFHPSSHIFFFIYSFCVVLSLYLIIFVLPFSHFLFCFLLSFFLSYLLLVFFAFCPSFCPIHSLFLNSFQFFCSNFTLYFPKTCTHFLVLHYSIVSSHYFISLFSFFLLISFHIIHCPSLLFSPFPLYFAHFSVFLSIS